MKEYGLPPYDAEVLCSEKGIATYFEETVSLAGDAKITSNWIMREVLEELKTESAGIGTFPITPARLAGLIGLVKSGAVSGTAGRDVFKEMLVSGDDAPTVVERLGLEQISGEGELETMVEEVLAENPKEVERYRGGKTQLLGYFVGQVMKRSGGKANPKLTNEILREKLKS